MLVDRLPLRARTVSDDDDRGAMLVTIIVVMLVGVIVASAVAASVVFTIRTNVENQGHTQAFVAAESGRDVAVGRLASAIGDDGLDCSRVVATGASAVDASPRYEYEVRSSADADRPATWEEFTVDCPTEFTKWVAIRSTGWGVQGSQATVDAVYPWYHGPATQPAGTLAFFEGEFKATKSTYQGDLVIRDVGNYACNNGSGIAVDGDLWVLNGGLELTGDCAVSGSVYVRGLIDVKNHGFRVGGDVISVDGSILLTANIVEIGGDIRAAGDIDTKNGSGIVHGTFTTSGVMKNHNATKWRNEAGGPVPVLQGQPRPVISPTLDQVFDATQWIELTSTTPWATGTDVVYTGVCSRAALEAILSSAESSRAIVDLSGCAASVGGKSTITVDPGSPQMTRDAVIVVPSTSNMDLKLSGHLRKAVGAGDPQLLIVHLDADGTDIKPTCTTGPDKLSVGTSINLRALIYSSCGISNTIALTMTGQIYMGNEGLHLNAGTFTCTPMSWQPIIGNLACGVKGAGGIFDPSDTVTRLEHLAYQTER
jgi:cytoskeletal protein CcmA (bactofilin family)